MYRIHVICGTRTSFYYAPILTYYPFYIVRFESKIYFCYFCYKIRDVVVDKKDVKFSDIQRKILNLEEFCLIPQLTSLLNQSQNL
jgi:hypothetical protein